MLERMLSKSSILPEEVGILHTSSETQGLIAIDDTRAWGPPYAKYTNDKEGPGESAYYLGVGD